MAYEIVAIGYINNDHNDHYTKDIGSEFQSDVENRLPSNGLNCFDGDDVDHNADDCDYSDRVRGRYDQNADINHNDDYCGDDGYDADNGDGYGSELNYDDGDGRENNNNDGSDVDDNKCNNNSDVNDDSHEDDDNGGSNGCVSNLDDMFDNILYGNHDESVKIKVGDESDGCCCHNVNHGDDSDVHYTCSEFCEGSVKYSGDNEVCGDKSDNDEGTSDYITCEDIDSNENYNIDYPADDIVDHALLQDNDEDINTTSNNNENIAQISSPLQLIKRCGVCSTREYETVMNTLEEFQTQSNWGKHKSLTSCFLQSSEITLDLRIILFLEQGMAEIMQKHFSLGKKSFRQALGFCSQSKNMCLLQGRALMFLGHAYRKEGPIKYGKAFKYLTLAQQNLCLVESREDQAELNYFLGALYLNLLSISIHEPCQRSRERIEKHYQAVYDYAMADTASRVREKVQRIFPLGMANFLLDGQTELARSRIVPDNKLKKAEDCLKHFADHFPFDEQPVSMQTDYCKSKSDLEYRRGNFRLSQDFLQKGLNISRRHNYHLEVQSLEKRLAMLKKCLPRVHVFLPQEDTADLADHSATVDSEINIFSSGSD